MRRPLKCVHVGEPGPSRTAAAPVIRREAGAPASGKVVEGRAGEAGQRGEGAGSRRADAGWLGRTRGRRALGVGPPWTEAPELWPAPGQGGQSQARRKSMFPGGANGHGDNQQVRDVGDPWRQQLSAFPAAVAGQRVAGPFRKGVGNILSRSITGISCVNIKADSVERTPTFIKELRELEMRKDYKGLTWGSI